MRQMLEFLIEHEKILDYLFRSLHTNGLQPREANVGS